MIKFLMYNATRGSYIVEQKVQKQQLGNEWLIGETGGAAEQEEGG